MTDPIARLREAGVSSSLAALRDRGVSGVTTNPTIFAEAITDGDAYDGQVRDLKLRQVATDGVLRELTATHVRQAIT
jgi:transaldolase